MHLAFASGSAQIWVLEPGSADPVRVTDGDWLVAGTPAWSPDGKEIAFAARNQESFHLYRVSAAGGLPIQLTASFANDGDPSYSPDGRWIFFSSDRSGDFEIWRMPAAKGPATQITRSGGVAPNLSHDGRFLYFSRLDRAGI